MGGEFTTVIDAGDLRAVVCGLFDRTIAVVAPSHPTAGPKDHIVSAEATLISTVIVEAMQRLVATGATSTDVYTVALRSALMGVAGEASLQGQTAVPRVVRERLLSQFDKALRTAHTMRVDR